MPRIPGAEDRFVDTGEVTLHAVTAGEGPLVVLLHGFPEFSWSWRHQLPVLVAAGFRGAAGSGQDPPVGRLRSMDRR